MKTSKFGVFPVEKGSPERDRLGDIQVFLRLRLFQSEGPILTEPTSLRDGGLDWSYVSYF